MNYIDAIFARSNIQQICHFLLYGTECVEIGPDDYKLRIEEAWEPVTAVLKQAFPDQDEYDKIANEVCNYAAVSQDAYMEIGMRCCLRLAAQLLIVHC